MYLADYHTHTRCSPDARNTMAEMAAAAAAAGLELDGAHIKVNADMATNVPGVFAAGDCVGAPYQAAKAAGEGNIAGISAAKYVENILKEEE